MIYIKITSTNSSCVCDPFLILFIFFFKGAFLDHNHTHFLLVDNGTEGKFGVEIPFRSALEAHMVQGRSLKRHLQDVHCIRDLDPLKKFYPVFFSTENIRFP